MLSVFNQWPEAGGYFDQDWFLIRDALTWQSLENKLKDQTGTPEEMNSDDEEWSGGITPLQW